MSFDIIEIPSGKIGLVEAKKGGNPAFSGRFGRVVECQNFQDEIAFINNGGQKGKQLSFLTAATYHINTEYFSVEIVDEICINEDQIGIVKAKYGRHLLLAQHFGNFVECNNFQDAQAFIENGGQQGKQLVILTSNTYSINTWIFEVTIGSITKIPLGEIGLVIANDGQVMPNHRKLGRSVECNNFQDAQAFINNGGESGKQLAILRDGKKYQINTELFTVITSANAEQYELKPEQLKYLKVEKEFIGIVTTTEGRTGLPYGLTIEGHDNFQGPQKFIDAGGYKGLQEEVLPEAEYSLNPWFVRVEQVPFVEIPVHCIGILLNVFPERIGHELENNAITMKPPGKHQINTAIQKVYIVPTNTIKVRWWNISRNTHLDYPPLIIRTNEESKEYLLHLILEFRIQKDSTYDSTYEFIKAVAGNLNELRVVSHEYLISTFVEGNLEDIVIDIYRCEISRHNHEELKTNEIQDRIKQQAKSKMMERCKPYYISIEENKESMSFFFSRDREEM